jgi:hypothetical protein
MSKSIEKRLERIEQKIGSDTTVIKSGADFNAYIVNVIKGIPVGKVTFGQEFAKWVEIIKKAACAYREGQDNEQEHLRLSQENDL